MSSQIGSGWGGESGQMGGVDSADPSLEEDLLGVRGRRFDMLTSQEWMVDAHTLL